MTLLLSDEDTKRSIDMLEAIDLIEETCRQQVAGHDYYGERLNFGFEHGWMRLMPAVLGSKGVIGYKEFHPSRDGMRMTYHLIDIDSGEVLAILDSNYLTSLRTGATAGLAARYLAPEDVSTLAVIGSGTEAAAQVEAAVAVRSFEKGKVYSRTPERREAFARNMSVKFGFDLQPAESGAKALRGCEMLVVATNTRGAGPALFGEWLTDDLRHINSIGSTLSKQREVETDVWPKADVIIVDTQNLLAESGDGIAAVGAGTLSRDDIAEIQELVTGTVPGRTNPDLLTFFKSVGTGLQDITVAYYAYRRAKEQGLGIEIPDFVTVKDLQQ